MRTALGCTLHPDGRPKGALFIHVPAVGINDQVVTYNVSGAIHVFPYVPARVFPPCVDCAVIFGLQGDVPNLVILDDVAPVLAVPQVDGMVRHVLDQVVAYHVAVA